MLICKYSLYDDIKKSVVSKRQLSVVLLASLIAVSLVFTVMLGTPAFAQNQTDTDGKTIEQATITMNAHLSNNPKCDTLEKYGAIMSPKCDSDKKDFQFIIITFPPKFFYHMFHSETGLVPVGGSYSDKMDYQLWAKYAGYLAQQNKLTQRGDTDFSSIKNEPVKVTVYLNENECKFVDGLGIKESDFSCKNEMHLYVPPSNFEKLADLDFVTTVKVYDGEDPFAFEELESSVSEQNPITTSITTESDTQDYTSYLPVLIIIPVSVVITLFWRLRKKAKIEV